eukprot:1159915-Pelagomonas_calceolata.AAC.3
MGSRAGCICKNIMMLWSTKGRAVLRALRLEERFMLTPDSTDWARPGLEGRLMTGDETLGWGPDAPTHPKTQIAETPLVRPLTKQLGYQSAPL